MISSCFVNPKILVVIFYHICQHFFPFYPFLSVFIHFFHSNLSSNFKLLDGFFPQMAILERNLPVISLPLHFLSIYLIL